MVRVPRIVVAAPASGQGKTTVATGLLAALTAKGLRATGFKVGPDYIDPSYHAVACGSPGRNLDPVLVGPSLIAPLFLHGARDAEVSIVEGVMGLYDGLALDFGSTAHVSRLLAAPVVMVIDASAQGRSVAAVLHGFCTFGDVRIAGVILNRVGSDRHEEILRSACAEVGVPVLGVLRRMDLAAVPSRHLGLVPAGERSATEAVAAMGSLVAGGVDLSAVMDLARAAPPLSGKPWAPTVVERKTRPTVAVAGGPAFTFGYREQLELIEAAGAVVAPFDPLRDEKLPAGTDAIVVGGGFPEVFGPDLAANVPLRREVKAFDGPIAAECAGLLWLASSLEGHEMCGVLEATATMTPRLTLGYRDAVALTPSFLAGAGTEVTGHEFHRTTVSPSAGPAPAWSLLPRRSCTNGGDDTRKSRERPTTRPRSSEGEAEGFVQGKVHASYLHTHWAGYPDLATRLVDAATRSEVACG